MTATPTKSQDTFAMKSVDLQMKENIPMPIPDPSNQMTTECIASQMFSIKLIVSTTSAG